MAYRPVLLTVRICAFCKASFEAKDRRRIYCTNSCNTRAWLARQPDQPSQQGEVSIKSRGDMDLDFSFKNVATMATGSVIAAGVNYVANDKPFYEALAKRIGKIEQQLGYSAGRASVESKKINMLIIALRRSSPEIDAQFRLIEIASANKLLP